MKRIASILFALALVTVLAGAASAHPCSPRINAREARQQFRIHEGVRGGQLTPRETARLRMNEVRIRHMENRAKSDRVLTMRERFRMHRALDRQSRIIFRLRHNGRMV